MGTITVALCDFHCTFLWAGCHPGVMGSPLKLVLGEEVCGAARKRGLVEGSVFLSY